MRRTWLAAAGLVCWIAGTAGAQVFEDQVAEIGRQTAAGALQLRQRAAAAARAPLLLGSKQTPGREQGPLAQSAVEQQLIDLLKGKDEEIAQRAKTELKDLAISGLLPETMLRISKLFDGQSDFVRQAACEILGRSGSNAEDYLPTLRLVRVKDAKKEVRAAAGQAIYLIEREVSYKNR